MPQNIGLNLHLKGLHFKIPSSERTGASFQKTFVWKDIGFISNNNEETVKSVKRPKT
jgi:hypothetical protein